MAKKQGEGGDLTKCMHGSRTGGPFEIMSLCNSSALGTQHSTLSIVEFQCAFVGIQNPNERKKETSDKSSK